jgi:hypothetical protein
MLHWAGLKPSGTPFCTTLLLIPPPLCPVREGGYTHVVLDSRLQQALVCLNPNLQENSR